MGRTKKKEKNIPRTKRFGGKVYSAWWKENTKPKAEKVAKQNRDSGTPARVVKVGDKYIVYTKGRIRN